MKRKGPVRPPKDKKQQLKDTLALCLGLALLAPAGLLWVLGMLSGGPYGTGAP